MGRFTPGVEGAIVNPETGERVPVGEKGIIAVVKVFVVLREGHEPSEKLITDIQQHVKRITAPYKYPREIEFVKELPKTISGKIKRKELRAREFERKRDVIEKLKEKGLCQRSE